MKKKLKVLVVILTFSLIGAGCGENSGGGVSILSKTDWPEMCAGKDLYEGFPKEYLMPDSLTLESTSVGFGGEKTSTGQEYAEKQDGFIGSFCAESSVEEVIAWYDKTLADKGFNKLGEMDGEHIFTKDSTTINVSAYNIAEGFVLYSFNIMEANF